MAKLPDPIARVVAIVVIPLERWEPGSYVGAHPTVPIRAGEAVVHYLTGDPAAKALEIVDSLGGDDA